MTLGFLVALENVDKHLSNIHGMTSIVVQQGSTVPKITIHMSFTLTLLKTKNITEFENHKSVLLLKTRYSTEIVICILVLTLQIVAIEYSDTALPARTQTEQL